MVLKITYSMLCMVSKGMRQISLSCSHITRQPVSNHHQRLTSCKDWVLVQCLVFLIIIISAPLGWGVSHSDIISESCRIDTCLTTDWKSILCLDLIWQTANNYKWVNIECRMNLSGGHLVFIYGPVNKFVTLKRSWLLTNSTDKSQLSIDCSPKFRSPVE